jgi:hypothetical protein
VTWDFMLEEYQVAWHGEVLRVHPKPSLPYIRYMVPLLEAASVMIDGTSYPRTTPVTLCPFLYTTLNPRKAVTRADADTTHPQHCKTPKKL